MIARDYWKARGHKSPVGDGRQYTPLPGIPSAVLGDMET